MQFLCFVLFFFSKWTFLKLEKKQRNTKSKKQVSGFWVQTPGPALTQDLAWRRAAALTFTEAGPSDRANLQQQLQTYTQANEVGAEVLGTLRNFWNQTRTRPPITRALPQARRWHRARPARHCGPRPAPPETSPHAPGLAFPAQTVHSVTRKETVV